MRALFTDGWNSFWHFVFGFIGAFFSSSLYSFIDYQLFDPYETNVLIDILEGLFGFVSGIYVEQGIRQSLVSPKLATT
jgi:hypothetical protein